MALRAACRISRIFKNIARPYSTGMEHVPVHEGEEALPRSITSHCAEVNGANIHYERTGTGKHVVLLLPGALGCARTDFAYQMEGMNRDLFTLIAWDPRGYGKSRPPERDWPVHFLGRDADDAAKLMETLDISRYSLVGWSDGGITALMVAARNPKLVQKMVVFGANAFVTDEDMKMYKGIKDTEKWSARMKMPYEKVYGTEYFSKHWARWVDAFEVYSRNTEGNICKEEVPNIKCPSLIIHGQKDPLVAQSHPDYLHKHIANSRLHNMPEGKHNLHMKFNKEFNSIVESFLLEQ